MNEWRHPNHRPAAALPAELRRAPVPEGVREWVHLRAGSPVVSLRRLPGASSTAVHALRLADGEVLVLRRYVWEKFRAEEPEAPAREVDALEYAGLHGLPVPEVIAADPYGAVVGDGIPTLLMARIPGRAQPTPDVRALAWQAAQVHAVSGSGFGHRYFPWCRGTSTAPPRGCRRPDKWEEALGLWRSAEPAYEECFVHRDFHPGNVLWLRGAVAGVVDWANACVGPPGIDVATCRWNLHRWAGEGAAGSFVTAYEDLTGRAHHPYWDLAWVMEHDWDLVADPERVWAAEDMLAQILPRLVV
ncbi:MAG TPA: aminoglycoside phosphotransferase family protein [Acidimicrobiales bacterium]|nr:aminoglycoside phosphotransferase family protein [Acidimicrobiales bacterium]